MNPTHIIISPGPGFPKDAGICIEAVLALHAEYPLLGVCLGHQAICEAFGGKIVHAEKLIHGKQSAIHIANGNALFRGLPPIINAGRYHSLIAERESLPNDLLIIAEDEASEIMGIKHRHFNTFGLQFHPESILSEQGAVIIKNFLGVGK
jgi:anthranilate synthase component 2